MFLACHRCERVLRLVSYEDFGAVHRLADEGWTLSEWNGTQLSRLSSSVSGGAQSTIHNQAGKMMFLTWLQQTRHETRRMEATEALASSIRPSIHLSIHHDGRIPLRPSIEKFLSAPEFLHAEFLLADHHII